MKRHWVWNCFRYTFSQIELHAIILDIVYHAIDWAIYINKLLLFFSRSLHMASQSETLSTSITRDPSIPIFNVRFQKQYQIYSSYNINMKSLKYRVYSVSSENEQYPARNLQQASGIWQSQFNCSYPQQITLQFFVPIQTKNMKILFHQYKIPKMIQVFVKCSKQQKYRKLGLIQPNDNSQSNYLQKQIKTVFFQFPCSYVKLVLHQNYRNEMNLFDQIALCQVNFEGEVLRAQQYKNLNINILDSLDTSSEQGDLDEKMSKQLTEAVGDKKISNFSSVLFPQFFEKMEQAKQQAVDKQQFQKASYIKNAIRNFQQMQKQIIKLEEMKRLALEQEDYDKCHKLKIQISKKKQAASYQIKDFNEHINDANSLTFSRASHVQQNVSHFTNRQNRLQADEKIQRTPAVNRNISPNPLSNLNQHESQVVPALRKKKNVQQSYISASKGNQSIDMIRSPTTQKKQELQPVEESVDYRTYELNRLYQQFPDLEQLEFKLFKKYQPFFDYIRLDLWRMVLSHKYQRFWKLKSSALDQIMNLQVQDGKQLIAIMQFVAITICNNHTVNIKKSLHLLQKLINLPNKDIWCDPNYPRFFVDTILTTLIQLMNDTKEQFRKLAVQIYKNLPQFSLVYLETSIRILIKTTPTNISNKNKRKINPRLQQAKLAVIEYYLSTFADVCHHLNQIIKWLAQCANDPNSDVKMTSIQMLLEVARMDKQLYGKVKEELTKQGNDVWASFEAQFNLLMAEISNSKMIEKLSEQNDSIQGLDIHKKETMKPKSKISVQNQSLKPIQMSMSSAVRSKRDGDQEIELAYSQQSGSYDRSRQSHDWFANNNSQNYNISQNYNNSQNYNSSQNYSGHNPISSQNRSSGSYSYNNEKINANIHEAEKEIRVMDLDNELQGLCDYCYQKYQQQSLTDHLLNNCPSVLPCAYCKGAIYLRQLTQHYLSSCIKKHQKCPRCLLAFEFDEINEHIARKICRKAKKDMQRCPFCEQDIEPDDVSWSQHSLKCQKIVRPSRNQELYTENSYQLETDR